MHSSTKAPLKGKDVYLECITVIPSLSQSPQTQIPGGTLAKYFKENAELISMGLAAINGQNPYYVYKMFHE